MVLVEFLIKFGTNSQSELGCNFCAKDMSYWSGVGILLNNMSGASVIVIK